MTAIHYDLHISDKDLSKYIKMHIDEGLKLFNDELNSNHNLDGFEFLIGKIDNKLINLKSQNIPKIFSMARGSTNGFKYNNEIWFIIHIVHQNNGEPRYYYHMFVKFDIDMNLLQYTSPFKFSDEGKLSFGALYEELLFEAASKGVTNLDYKRRTAASYIELQSKFDKINFILGGRAEDYNITGNTDLAELTAFKQFRFFPNASAQYNFNRMINFNVNYNKKITLPSTSALNPNNTNYQNPNIDYSGNPNLQPTIYNNYEAKISAFDYAFISYNISSAKNQVINRVSLQDDLVINTNENLPEIKIHNFSAGLPIPYMLFTKGLAETMKMNVNPDTMNFLYVYAGYQYHDIPNVDTKGFWMFNFMSQLVLPKKIKFVANYNYIIPKGNYFYFIAVKPFRNSLDFSFSKKFLKDQLTLSIYADDILNINENAFNSYQTPLLISNKTDTRKFGFSLNYKIPTKNKLAKETPSLLNNEKKEESGLVN